MRTIGIILLVIGLIAVVNAYNMNTVVETEAQFIGGNYVPSQKVHNIGLMDKRRNELLVSCLVAVIGVGLFVASTFNSKSNSTGRPLTDNSRVSSFRAVPKESERMQAAIVDNNLAAVRRLLETKECFPHGELPTGRSWLVYATVMGRPEIAKIFVEYGVDPKAKDSNGNSAIYMVRLEDQAVFSEVFKLGIEDAKKFGVDERVLSNDAYKIYLTRSYPIERNDLLGKFIYQDKLYDSADDALAAARLTDIALREAVS